MDQTKLDKYRLLIKKILSRYAELSNLRPKPEREAVTVFDDENGHYLLHKIGWNDKKRVWNTTLYVRIRNEKFWIEIDWTEEGITAELLDAGVPQTDIVLAFHHPSVREYTDFAVA